MQTAPKTEATGAKTEAATAAPAETASVETKSSAGTHPSTSAGNATTEAVSTGAAKQRTEVEKTEDRKLAALARLRKEEAKLQRDRELLKQERAQIEALQTATRDAIEAKKRDDELRKLAGEDPRKILDAYGVKFEDLAKRYIAGDQRTPEQVVQAEIAKLKEELATERKKHEDETNAAKQAETDRQVLAGAMKQIEEMAEANAEKYPEVVRGGDWDKVWKYVEEYYEETAKATGTGMVLDFAEALALREKKLQDRLSARQPKAEKKQQAQKEEAKPAAQMNEAQKAAVDKLSSRVREEMQRRQASPEGAQAPKARKAFNYTEHARNLIQNLAASRDI